MMNKNIRNIIQLFCFSGLMSTCMTCKLTANESIIQAQNFEAFSSILEKRYPSRKPPVYDYAPTAIKVDNTFKMWWLGHTKNPVTPDQGDSIFYAESVDGINWSEPTIALQPSTENPYDYGYYVGNPSVIKVAETYHMYLSAGRTSHSESGELVPANAIGYTTSQDGLTWEEVKLLKYSSQTNNECCGNYGVGEPSVVFLDGFFYMAYIDTTNKASNPVNGSGIYMIRSSSPDFSGDLNIITHEGELYPLTPETETQSESLWSNNIFGGEFAWSDDLERFVYLRGGTSKLLFADRNLRISQNLNFPQPQHQWREENTFVRTSEGHVLDFDANPQNGIDLLVIGGYVTPDVDPKTQKKPEVANIWWTDLQATKVTLFRDDQNYDDTRLVLRVKYAESGCPQGYEQVALIGQLIAQADYHNFSDGEQNWLLCSLQQTDSKKNFITVQPISKKGCPKDYVQVASLGRIPVGVKGNKFELDESKYWILCTLRTGLQDAIVLRKSQENCPASYSSIGQFDLMRAWAKGVELDEYQTWQFCSLPMKS